MTPPTDPPASDDALADWLAEYDEAVATGRPPPPLEAVPAAEQCRLRASCALLRQLDRLWPRSAGPATGQSFPFPFGRFQVHRQLGAGGCGVVFLATDSVLGRPVALKLPRVSLLADADARRRFLREARAAAILSHPNVVPVYEANEFDGVCFLAMEFCDGPTLARWLAEQPGRVPVEQAARLTAAVAAGIGYAHRRGVVHRDLKPANILLADADRTPRVADFGLAMLADETDDATRTGVILGTPQYMAPEQARGDRALFGPATDVYAVGAILYELLTGRPPVVGQTVTDTLRRIAADAPASPRVYRPDVPADLEAVCLKCLDHDPARRYADGEALAADLERYLAGQPTVARPVLWPERAAKWVGRNRVVSGLTAAVFVALVTATGFALRAYERTDQLNAHLQFTLDREREADRLRRQAGYRSLVLAADHFRRNGQDAALRRLLDDAVPREGEEDLRDFAWRYLRRQAGHRQVVEGHRRPVYDLAVSDDGRWIASAAGEATVLVRDAATGALRSRLNCGPLEAYWLAWVGDRLAVAAETGADGVRVQLRDATTGDRTAEWVAPFRAVNRIAAGPGATVLVAGDHRDGGAALLAWDSVGGTHRGLWRDAGSCRQLKCSPDRGRVAWTHRLAGDHSHDELLTLDLDRPGEPTRWLALKIGIETYDFSPDGGQLAVMSNDTCVRVLDLATTQVRWKQDTEIEPVSAFVSWAAGGAEVLAYRVNTARRARFLRRAAADGHPLGEEDAHLPALTAVARSPDARRVYFGCADGSVYWHGTKPDAADALAGHRGEVWGLAFSPDGRLIATGSDDATIKVWDAATGRERATLIGHPSLVLTVAFLPDGTLASGGWDGTVRLWDVAAGTAVATWKAHAAPVQAVLASADGRHLVTKSRDGTVKRWDGASRQAVQTWPGDALKVGGLAAVGPDGRFAATNRRTVELFDPPASFAHHTNAWSLAAPPGGDALAVGDEQGMIQIRNTADPAAPPRSWWAHAGGVRALAFHPAGRLLASAGLDSDVKVWHAATGQLLLTLSGHKGIVNRVAFSPDGHTLASASHDGTVRLWRTAD